MSAFHPKLTITHHCGRRLLQLFGMMASWITNGFPKRLTTFAVTRTSFRRLAALVHRPDVACHLREQASALLAEAQLKAATSRG